MPVRMGLGKRNVLGEDELRAELRSEIEEPKESGEPVIVIEKPHPGTTHLYVIWSK